MPEHTPETWKPIPGYEGLYEVSDHGRVKSVLRRTWFVNRWGQETQRIVPERIREQSVHPNGGHLYLTLHKEGKRKQWFVHVLVLMAFVGPRPTGCDETRHLDGNPTNNHLGNLRWATHQENVDDMLGHGTHRNARKTHCIHGHEFTPANTYIRPDGNRDCKACAKSRQTKEDQAAYMREYRRKKRQRMNPTQ